MCETLSHHDFSTPASESKPESEFWAQIEHEKLQRYTNFLNNLPFTEESLNGNAHRLYTELKELILNHYRKTGLLLTRINTYLDHWDPVGTKTYELNEWSEKIPQEFIGFNPYFVNLEPYTALTIEKQRSGIAIRFDRRMTYFSKVVFDDLAKADGITFVQRPDLFIVDKHIKVAYARKLTQ